MAKFLMKIQDIKDKNSKEGSPHLIITHSTEKSPVKEYENPKDFIYKVAEILFDSKLALYDNKKHLGALNTPDPKKWKVPLTETATKTKIILAFTKSSEIGASGDLYTWDD